MWFRILFLFTFFKRFKIIYLSIFPVFDHCVLQRCITDDRAELSSIEWLPSIVWYIIAIEIVHATNVLDVPMYFDLVLTIGRESTIYHVPFLFFFLLWSDLLFIFHWILIWLLLKSSYICTSVSGDMYQEIPFLGKSFHVP